MFGDLWRRIQADARLSSIFKGGASGVLSKGLTMAVSAITLPLTVRYLGKLEYGIWITISTSIVMLAVLDLGIANTLTNVISKAFAQNDEPMAQRYFATALWITVLIAAVLGLCGIMVFRWIDWARLFSLHDPEIASQARTCVAIAFGFFLLSLPLNLANRVLSGYQKVHLGNYFGMLSSVLGLVAIVGTILMHGSLAILMTAYCVSTLMGALLLNVWLCFWYRPGLKPLPGAVNSEMTRELFSGGGLFFVLQLAGLVVFNSDNLVITHYLGASEVTPYSVAWRLCGYASMFQSLLIPSLWPAFSEAYHRGDLAWIRKTHRRFMMGTLSAVAVVAVLIGLLGRTVIRIWAGPAAVPSAPLLWLMSFWVVLLSYTVNQALLLAATERIQVQALSSSVAAIVNLALSIVLVQRMGAIGVLVATVVSYLIFILAPQMWEERRILSGRYLTRVTEC